MANQADPGKNAQISRRVRHAVCAFVCVGVLVAAENVARSAESGPHCRSVLSLDGRWLLATDPANQGVEQAWFQQPVGEAKETKVPWIIQDAFPGYHGVAWYWREFQAPANPHAGGRYLLRFWAVDYKADVWLNGTPVGSHEGGETPFTLDVTDTIRPAASNRLAVRVLNPTHSPIDGIVLAETPHRNKALPYSAGSSYNHGGILDSVELLVTPACYVTDLFARPDAASGKIRVSVTVHNSLDHPVDSQLEVSVAPDPTGGTQDVTVVTSQLPAGEAVVDAELMVDGHRLWDLGEPNLYRVTARLYQAPEKSLDETSVRCGFRDFVFENGYFRLNGRRMFLRCSHTGNHCPVGLQFPPDPDMFRRDLLNVKVMGFNAIRFIAGVATRYQLDLCDEIGLLVYEEHYGSWVLADSSKMSERYDRALREMILRDRNHASIVMWGLLNETSDGPVFRHAAATLPMVRSLDDTRMVMLNSGRWDLQVNSTLSGLEVWCTSDDPDPNVTRNSLDRPLSGLGVTWQPGQMALHPGPQGEYSVARWIVPDTGEFHIESVFTGIAQAATTDVHLLHNGQPLHQGVLNLDGSGNESVFAGPRAMTKGDSLDFVVGMGNGFYGADTTALAARIRREDVLVADVAKDFSVTPKQDGSWQYGFLAPGPRPDSRTFTRYPVSKTRADNDEFGTLANPGSAQWEPVLADQHPYQRVPHTAQVIRFLRTVSGGTNPLFVSEYGVGSGVDLWRVTRHYERLGKQDVEDAQFYRDKLDRFLADWDRWKMNECFTRPEDFFAQSIRQMAAERLYGLNALRANPELVAHSVTGTVDQGMSGEGLFTTFRELKPGTADAMFEAWAPLRLCMFVEPLHVYRGSSATLEIVLANEDALAPGEYPVRVSVVGPDMRHVFQRVVTVAIAAKEGPGEAPFAARIFLEEVTLDVPQGAYRFLATMERGGAPTGGETVFHVTDPAEMPPLATEVVLWGADAELQSWFDAHAIKWRPFRQDAPDVRELIVVGTKPPAAGGDVWRELVRRIAGGASVVFVSPEVFKNENEPTRWLPLKNHGTVTTMMSWLYHKDEWAKRHPVFDGLPSGGMMDYAFYREIIPDAAFVGLDPPLQAIAGVNNVSFDYASGLTVAEHQLGAGRFLLNTLLLRENLGRDPLAERLLRNILRYAARELNEPVTPLPAEFDELLKELGY
ncbi:MAG: glycoside hydrolase family 2 protein [Pirellulaceae bacterium]